MQSLDKFLYRRENPFRLCLIRPSCSWDTHVIGRVFGLRQLPQALRRLGSAFTATVPAAVFWRFLSFNKTIELLIEAYHNLTITFFAKKNKIYNFFSIIFFKKWI
jgi:hypothetical protein